MINQAIMSESTERFEKEWKNINSKTNLFIKVNSGQIE